MHHIHNPLTPSVGLIKRNTWLLGGKKKYNTVNLKNTDLCQRCSKGLKDRGKCFGVLTSQCFSNIRLFLPAVLSFSHSTATGKKNLCFHPCTTWFSLWSKCSKSVTGESFPWLPQHFWSLTSAGNGFQADFCLTSEPCKIVMRCVFCLISKP